MTELRTKTCTCVTVVNFKLDSGADEANVLPKKVAQEAQDGQRACVLFMFLVYGRFFHLNICEVSTILCLIHVCRFLKYGSRTMMQ